MEGEHRHKGMTEHQLLSLIVRKLDVMDEMLEEIRNEGKNTLTTVEEVQAAVVSLTSDLESLAATAKAEFAKLEEEVAAGKEPELGPLKESIDALDAKVQEAAKDVPTN